MRHRIEGSLALKELVEAAVQDQVISNQCHGAATVHTDQYVPSLRQILETVDDAPIVMVSNPQCVWKHACHEFWIPIVKGVEVDPTESEIQEAKPRFDETIL
jgi:hypothetical protein